VLVVLLIVLMSGVIEPSLAVGGFWVVL
jgi:hypothetical protein